MEETSISEEKMLNSCSSPLNTKKIFSRQSSFGNSTAETYLEENNNIEALMSVIQLENELEQTSQQKAKQYTYNITETNQRHNFQQFDQKLQLNQKSKKVNKNSKKSLITRNKKQFANSFGFSGLSKGHICNTIKNIGYAFLDFLSKTYNINQKQNILIKLLKTQQQVQEFLQIYNKKNINFSGINSIRTVFFGDEGEIINQTQKKVLRIMFQRFLRLDFISYSFRKSNKVKDVKKQIEFKHQFLAIFQEIQKQEEQNFQSNTSN